MWLHVTEQTTWTGGLFQSAAAESRQDWSSLVLIITSTTSDPIRSGPRWHPVCSIRDFRVYIDADMTMRTHITAVVRACFIALRQIWSVQRSLSRHALLTLVRALVVTKVDYCNSVLAGISGMLQDQLQSVLNAAARLVFSARCSECINAFDLKRLCIFGPKGAIQIRYLSI